MSTYDVIIVGAGIAGLSAAVHLQNEGLRVKVLEADKEIGGRMRTDKFNGYLLDRGFQVLLTAYPEALRMLDYKSLQLRNFNPGALVHYKGKMRRMSDPFRQPSSIFSALFSPISNWGDKAKVLALRNRYKRLSIDKIFKQPETSTLSFLQEWHFSPTMINAFFKPFLGGIFLDQKLETSSRMCKFVLKMFMQGSAALPAQGMQAIPQQLADKLHENTIQTNATVQQIQKGKVKLQNGEVLHTKMILVASNVANLPQLLPQYATKNSLKTQTTQCLYFSTKKLPIRQEPILLLNGNGTGLINNICFPSTVQASYAPPNRHLLSVSVIKKHQLSDEELLDRVQTELHTWFGTKFQMQHLRTYTVKNALPNQLSIKLPKKNKIRPFSPGIYVCGDHTYHGSIHGAMESARYTANAISWDLALSLTT